MGTHIKYIRKGSALQLGKQSRRKPQRRRRNSSGQASQPKTSQTTIDARLAASAAGWLFVIIGRPAAKATTTTTRRATWNTALPWLRKSWWSYCERVRMQLLASRCCGPTRWLDSPMSSTISWRTRRLPNVERWVPTQRELAGLRREGLCWVVWFCFLLAGCTCCKTISKACEEKILHF